MCGKNVMTKDDHKLAVKGILSRYGMADKIGIVGVLNEISEISEKWVRYECADALLRGVDMGRADVKDAVAVNQFGTMYKMPVKE